MAIFTRRKQNSSKNARKRLRTAALLLALCLLLTGFSGCRKEEKEEVPEGVIRIGVLEPLTGDDAEGAKAELRGIELANRMRTKANGCTIELVYADNGSTLKGAVAAAETLRDKGCVCAIGSYGNMLTLAASDTLRNAQIPLVNVTGTNPLLTGTSPYLFRTATVETDQAMAAADYLRDTLGLTDYAILLPANDDYARSMADEFATAAGYACKTVSYLAGTDDFSTQVQALRSCDVRAVFLPGSAEDAAAFLKAAVAAGAKWTYFGTQKLKTEEFLSLSLGYADGLYTTGDWDPFVAYTDASSTFLRVYRLHYGESAVPTEAEALGYEAYMLLVDAIERTEEQTGPAIRTALGRTEAFPGVTGLSAMDKEGDLNRAQTVWMIADGSFVNPLTYVAPKSLLKAAEDLDEQ